MRSLEQTLVDGPQNAPLPLTQVTAPGMPPLPGHRTGITQLHIETHAGHDPAGTHAGQIWGDFRIGELLGRGGMGAVYKAVQISLDRPVAIKVLPQHLSMNESFRERFQREAKAVAMLSSPNVIQVYAAGVQDGHHYFAMEFVEGQDLARRVHDGLRLTFNESLGYVTQAARGLAAAGDLGIVHRDIKPANMMVTGKGLLKLMDFGLVKLASDEHTMTMAGTVMGTVSYFSPEQGRGERCDTRTDIYALGIVLYELLTGRLPFTGADATSIIYQHIHVAPLPPKEIDPAIPDDFQAVVLKCLQKRPEDRYESAQEMLADLERLARSQPPTIALTKPSLLRSGATVIRQPPFPQESSKAARPGSPWPLVAGVAAAVALAVGGAAWWLARRGPTPPPAPSSTARVPIASTPAQISVPTPTPTPAPSADARTAAPLPPVTPDQPLVDLSRGATPDQVRGLVRAGHLDQARRLADQGLAQAPASSDWADAAHAVDQAQGAALLLSIGAALDQGELENARSGIAQARHLIPDSHQLDVLAKRLADLDARHQQRLDAITRAEAQLAAGDWATALPALEQLDAQKPGDESIAGMLVRARALEAASERDALALKAQLAAGDAALAGKDYDLAQASYAGAARIDAHSSAAAAGLAQVAAALAGIQLAGTAFDQAMARNDLDAAQQQLDQLQKIAPHAQATNAAAQKLQEARATAEQARREAELKAAQVTASVRALIGRIEDPAQPLDGLTREVQTMINGLPEGAPERALLSSRLDDRIAHDQIAGGLSRLDAAVLAGNGQAISALVDDHAFAAALAQLKGYDGLVFSSRMASCLRHGDDASVVVKIRHALAVFPLTELVYDLACHRGQDGSWHITSAQLHPLQRPGSP